MRKLLMGALFVLGLVVGGTTVAHAAAYCPIQTVDGRSLVLVFPAMQPNEPCPEWTQDASSASNEWAFPAEVRADPFLMDLETGALLGGAVWLLWAVAFGFRTLFQFVREG